MDLKDQIAKVPQLLFPLFKEESGHSSARSEFDDIFFSLSRRDENSTHPENLEDQIDRLNQILENVMCEVTKSNEKSLSISKINDSGTDTSEYSKSYGSKIETSSFLTAIQETDGLLSYIRRLEMNIQDLESRRLQRNYSNSSCEFRKEIELNLEQYILHARRVLNNPILSVSLEQALNCIKGFSEESMCSIDLLVKGNETKKLEAMYNEESLMHCYTFEQILSQNSNEEVQDNFQFLIELYNNSLSLLCQQISNLTSREFTFTGNTPEIELPRLVSNIAMIVSEVISREKHLELCEKEFPKISFAEKLQIACTYGEMLNIKDRISDIIKELSEYGSDKDYSIKVGLLNIAISVYFSDECKSKYYPSTIDSDFFDEHDQCRSRENNQELIREGTKYSACNLIRTEESKKNQIYVQELQEQVIELNTKIMNLEAIREMEEGMKNGIENAVKERIEELELIVDQQQFEIELQRRQIFIYRDEPEKNCISSCTFKDYSSRFCDLIELENILRMEYQKNQLEKQKTKKNKTRLIEKERTFYEKSREFSQSFADAEENSAQSLKKSMNTEAILQTQETPSQTTPLIPNYLDDLAIFEQQLTDIFNELQHQQSVGNTSPMLEKINRIRHKLNNFEIENNSITSEKLSEIMETKIKKVNHIPLKKLSTNLKEIDQDTECLDSKSSKLEKQLVELQNLYLNIENLDVDHERAIILKDKMLIQKHQQNFDKKKSDLKKKILQVNDRQRKLIDLEKELNEKKTKLIIQTKKQEYYKQAIDEEWNRIDGKRQDVIKCQQIIDEEWQRLIENTTILEKLQRELE